MNRMRVNGQTIRPYLSGIVPVYIMNDMVTLVMRKREQSRMAPKLLPEQLEELRCLRSGVRVAGGIRNLIWIF